MSWIAFIRHGRTTWNERGRIQGRTDTPLSAAGIEEVRCWRLPGWLRTARWVSSPLQRAVKTARLQGFEPEIHAPLVETAWGDFEGLDRRELHRQIAVRNLDPGLGVDFRPPGGESPRMVAARLETWLQEWAESNAPLVAVTHKGVIRAALHLATGWDMREDYPEQIRWDCAHLFRFDGGRFLPVELNIPLRRTNR